MPKKSKLQIQKERYPCTNCIYLKYMKISISTDRRPEIRCKKRCITSATDICNKYKDEVDVELERISKPNKKPFLYGFFVTNLLFYLPMLIVYLYLNINSKILRIISMLLGVIIYAIIYVTNIKDDVI